jgi:hypothetical protein
MKIDLVKDEMYPVFYKTYANDRGYEYDIPEDLWKEYQSALKKFKYYLRKIDKCVDDQKQT